MGLSEFYNNHVLFNFFSFGTLLVTIFTALFAYFFLTLPNKSESTFHLGIAFLFLSLFNLGYFFAASLYHPTAAYHRWLTGCFVLPAILHFGQFFFKYPRDTNPAVSKKVLIGMWAVAIIASILFISKTFDADKKFHFTGHYWDFDSESTSKLLGVLIAIYCIISFLVIGIWKISITKVQKDRKVLIQILIAMLIAAISPNITNILSRDGLLDRTAYLISLTLFFVVGFFIISLVYVNSTKDRTTFMVKIVGVTMVSMLMIMQASTFYSMKDKDADYDSLRLENFSRILEGGDKHRDGKYFIQLDLANANLQKTDYPEGTNLDLPLIEVDFLNTVMYDDLKFLSTENFRNDTIDYLNKSHVNFEGYKFNILDFLNENKDLDNVKLKAEILPFLDSLNKASFVHRNKISLLDINFFCSEINSYLQKKSLVHFKNSIDKSLSNCKWENRKISGKELRSQVIKFFRNFKPSLTRHFRKSTDDSKNQNHFVSYIFYDRETKIVSEVGYSYFEYRKYMHSSASNQQMLLLIVVITIFSFFPLFFRGSLINPLWELVHALEKVNMGDLEVEVPIKVNDEIGFLSESFNTMVISIRFARSELQMHLDTLEEKVKSRTKQVEEQMDEVQKLKVQQDGDYFLTSLLAKPLIMNANKSEPVKTNFIIKQKKHFEFKNKEVEIGGDICITGNLRLGSKTEHKRYTMTLNADAMGKSMQGAGGSIVMGVVMNSIMARSAAQGWILDKTPETWLTDVYYEIHRVFKAFNGSMVISCIIMLIEDETGEVYYFNAEHPYSVLYRNGKAQFIEDRLNLRKLGLDSEIPFQVFKFELMKGDIIIMGSDGRDDIDLTPNEPVRTINEDENLFLEHVIKGEADLDKIYSTIIATGELIDDFSLLRIGYKESEVELKNTKVEILEDYNILNDVDFHDMEYIYTTSIEMIKENRETEARVLLHQFFYFSDSNQSFSKINKLLGLLSYKSRDYETASEVIKKILEVEFENSEFLYYLGIIEKKLGMFQSAFEIAEKLRAIEPNHSLNLLNLADLSRLIGKEENAITLTRKVLEIEPENQTAKRLLTILNRT